MRLECFVELKVTRLVMYGNRARAHFDELAQFWREKLEMNGVRPR